MNALQTSTLWQTCRRFFSYAQADTRFVVLVIITVVGLTVTNTAMVWLIGVPFDHLQAGRFDEVKQVLLWLVLMVALNQAFHLSSTLTANWLGLRFVGRLRQAVMRRLLDLSVPGTARLQRGDILARLSKDVDMVQDMVLEVPLFLVSHLLTLVFYGAMLFWIDWSLALAALLMVPLFFVHQWLFGARKRRASERFYHENGELLAFEEQALNNLRGISSVGAEARMAGRHATVFEQARRWAMKMRWLDQGFEVTLAGLIYLGGIGVVLLGIERIEAGLLGVGELVSFLVYLGYLSVPVRGFAQAPMQLQGDVGAAQRVLELFELAAETCDAPDAKPLQFKQGDIRLEGLGFAYAGAEPVLENVDLHIPAGETVALVGPSGAGKSTLARLLMRFHDPQCGRITIDGCDLRQVTIDSLRDHFSVIWQEPFIVNDTVRANLLLGRPEATEDELLQACEASGAQLFIGMLDEGLDTRIGSGGVELSGGQYQRIAIARAMLRDTPFLILDEATSALDSQSEREVVEALERLRKGRTTLVIAHRYSSIRNADRVVYFNDDGTVLVGEHDALYASHSPYRAAVAWQSEAGVAQAG
jgi:ATP-binding cassette subfamily B protein